MPSSYYDSFCNAFYREPLRLSEESILEYLRRVLAEYSRILGVDWTL